MSITLGSYDKESRVVVQRLALWALDEKVPNSIPSKIDLGNEIFYIGFGLGVLGGALEVGFVN